MHAPLDRYSKSDQSTPPKIDAGFLIIPTLIAIVLLALAICEPKTSIWISEAVQAEFAGSIADEPSPQTAQPAAPIRTVTPIDVSAGLASSQR
jgi:hypothetical protein